jgi:hypothetical protein
MTGSRPITVGPEVIDAQVFSGAPTAPPRHRDADHDVEERALIPGFRRLR